jgi:hypothetical protein
MRLGANERFGRHNRRMRLGARRVAALVLVGACHLLLLSGARAGTVLPKSFTGSLSGSETEAPWSYGTGRFTGYHATFAFTKLVFGQGAQGPYTLLSGALKFKGFVESLRAPTGGAPGVPKGICTAHYTFQLVKGKPFSGDLGGFSETGGVWNATLDLGIQTQAYEIHANGCGPNLENAESEFGNPARLALSISVKGTFNPSTGVVSFAAPQSTPASRAGGARTDVVNGTLHGSG